MTSRWADEGARVRLGPLPAELEVRAARPADCTAVAAIEHERDGVDLDRAAARCLAHVDDPGTLLLVAAASGTTVGFGRAILWTPPADAPADAAPGGWYLLGLAVRDRWRRRGIGLELTRRRLEWIRERADEAVFVTNTRNRASLDLHRKLGFVEVTRDFWFPGASFDGGVGVLARVDLRGWG